jgi:AcrR family transcriptional regulator
VLDAAREVLRREGVDRLTMRRLASELDMKAPSLYRHFPNKAAIIEAIQREWFEGLHALYAQALAEQPDKPAAALACSYRAWALADPQIYQFVVHRAAPRSLTELLASARRLWAGHLGRDVGGATWAFTRGMVEMEITDRFPRRTDLDAVWRVGLEALQHAADQRATAPATCA